MKIAPTLRWHIQVPFTTVRKVMVDDTPKMAAELRALLAVAKATRFAMQTEHGDWGKATSRMLNALARLERVSKEKP